MEGLSPDDMMASASGSWDMDAAQRVGNDRVVQTHRSARTIPDAEAVGAKLDVAPALTETGRIGDGTDWNEALAGTALRTLRRTSVVLCVHFWK